MKKGVILISGLLFVVGIWAQNYSDTLTMELARLYDDSDLPGFSVSIVSESEVLYENSFGFANKEKQTEFENSTILNLGSVTKTIVGLALVKAIADDKLTMDTPINDILPFRVDNPFYKDEPILIKHLANHTSSILDTKHYGKTYILDQQYVENENTHQGFLEFIKGHASLELKDFLFKILNEEGEWYKKKNFLKQSGPGSIKEYSNLNAALTAYIIELATEMPFDEYTQAKIFEPLGMNYTSWKIEKEKEALVATGYFPAGNQVPSYRLITYPDGGLFSNTTDLSKYLIEMIKAYSGNSTFLPLEYAEVMLPGDEDSSRAFWGMGVESRNIGHGGSDPGAQTDLHFNADRKLGRIILTNVNAEDNEVQWKQYQRIHEIIAQYENML